MLERTSNAERKRDRVLEKASRVQADHCERVSALMEQALIAEEERQISALSKTSQKAVGFLSKLQLLEKEKEMDLKKRLDDKSAHWTIVRQRQDQERRKLVQKRRQLDRKDHEISLKVQLAKDDSVN